MEKACSVVWTSSLCGLSGEISLADERLCLPPKIEEILPQLEPPAFPDHLHGNYNTKLWYLILKIKLMNRVIPNKYVRKSSFKQYSSKKLFSEVWENCHGRFSRKVNYLQLLLCHCPQVGEQAAQHSQGRCLREVNTTIQWLAKESQTKL